MIFSVLTLFPDLVTSNIQSSITGRALERGLFSFFAHDIRRFAINEYGKVDDSLYGGGKGMLMMCEPIYQTWLEALAVGAAVQRGKGGLADLSAIVGPTYSAEPKPTYPQLEKTFTLAEAEKANPPDYLSDRICRTIYLSPKGRTFNQALACELAQADQLVFLCGHYEGVDQRVLSKIEAEEVSLGDFVITGGELAACIMMDAIARMLPGVLPASEAFEEESHYNGVLECRQYTKPAQWRGFNVPDVLQSGHHARIERWRRLDGLRETYLKRPDLFSNLQLSPEEGMELAAYFQELDGL